MSKKHHHHHHHHKKCQSCNEHRPHYHKHCHHHHHKHHDHHHHKRHCYHHKRYYRHHIVCPECPPVPPTPTITYACSGTPDFTCGPVLDGSGYATLLECQTACTAPVNLLLGTAANFRVLAGSTITDTAGLTTIDGNLGLAPGTAVTGDPVVTGASYVGPTNAVALQAKADLTTAYNTIRDTLPVTQNLTGQDLGGMTLAPGVYKFDINAGLTGDLILDAGGDSSAVWMFQIDTTLITAAASSVTVINSGLADNVYWQVGSSATLGTTTAFVGNILADQTITLNTGATIHGRALASVAAVNFDTNTVEP